MAYGAVHCNKNIMALFNHFWRRTPPALFPSLLGLFGLSLAWRRAAQVWEVPAAIGEGLGLIATIILLVTLSSYVAKLCIRPGVLWDELIIDPARGSVSAGSMCAMAMAAYLLPYTSLGAFLIWWMSLGLHGVYFACIALIVLRHENTMRQFNPVILLPAAGILVATLAAPGLGYVLFSQIILAVSIPASAIILAMCLWNAARHGVQQLHRSSYAAFLVPPSVAALGVYNLNGETYFMPVWIGACLVGAGLLPFVRWMTKGGWSANWGIFCFPLAAFSAVQILAVQAGYGLTAQILAVSTLTVSSVLIPYILILTYQSWFAGRLAEATKAAVA